VAVALKGAPFAVEGAARWMAVHKSEVPDEAVRRTIEELIERRLLKRGPALKASVEGRALLGRMPLPETVRLFANERQARRDAMRALSATGATFVTAWIATLMLAERDSSHRYDGTDDARGDWGDGGWGGGDWVGGGGGD
jgi:hypothetical protein